MRDGFDEAKGKSVVVVDVVANDLGLAAFTEKEDTVLKAKVEEEAMLVEE